MRRALAVLLVALASCSSGPSAPPTSTELAFETASGRVSLHVEVADDATERETGLMGRSSLPEDAGMAFLWTDPVHVSFWMKDTLIPLSIAFWSESGAIVSILDMAPCRADPCRTYDPGVPFVGAVEVNQGYFDANGIAVGDRVDTSDLP